MSGNYVACQYLEPRGPRIPVCRLRRDPLTNRYRETGCCGLVSRCASPGIREFAIAASQATAGQRCGR